MSPDYSPTSPRGFSPTRFVIDHNPFYLLSAVCMLFACLTLTNSLSYSPLPQWRLLLLIGALNAYEFLLIGIALWLIVSRKLLRDGIILLGIEALFLLDGAFLNSEIFAADMTMGFIVNLILLALAAAKLFVILRVLKLPLVPTFPAIFALVTALFGMSGVFKYVSGNGGWLPEGTLYAAWWAIGLLPIVMLPVLRMRGIAMIFGAIGTISLLAHLCLASWVYKVIWEAPNLSPLLLGTAVAIGAARHMFTHETRQRVQMLLPILAILLSASSGRDLMFEAGTLTFSPLRLTLLGTAAVYVHALIIHQAVVFIPAAMMALFLAVLGSTPDSMGNNTSAVVKTSTGWFTKLLPETAAQWGVVSLVASFVLLIVGAGVSTLKRSPDPEEFDEV
jgi:hypothetical protein